MSGHEFLGWTTADSSGEAAHRVVWRRWSPTASTTHCRLACQRRDSRDGFRGNRDADGPNVTLFLARVTVFRRRVTLRVTPGIDNRCIDHAEVLSLIPLLLSLALAGGVYLTFDGFVRPRRMPLRTNARELRASFWSAPGFAT